MNRSCLFAFALLLPGTSIQAAPPPLFSPNLPAYLRALNQSMDPEAQAIRARIASGPADLARERALAEKEGIVTRAGQSLQILPAADQNAAPLFTQLDALRKQKPFYLTNAAESFSSSDGPPGDAARRSVHARRTNTTRAASRCCRGRLSAPDAPDHSRRR